MREDVSVRAKKDGREREFGNVRGWEYESVTGWESERVQ